MNQSNKPAEKDKNNKPTDKKDNKKLDEKLKDTFPASDSTAKY